MRSIAPPAFPLPGTTAKPKKPNLKAKPALKFYGPVHVLVIDPKGEYCWTVWFAIVLGLANVLIGAVNVAVLAYAVASGDAHAFICTLAYHFFSVEAILSLNYANGWSTPMLRKHRRFAHVLLQICGMCCAVAGTTIICVAKGVSGSAHGIAGLITAGFACISILTGASSLLKNRIVSMIHMGVGCPTFTVSSVCLILGFLTQAFEEWASTSVVVVVISFTVFYTIVVIGTVFVKLVSRIKNRKRSLNV